MPREFLKLVINLIFSKNLDADFVMKLIQIFTKISKQCIIKLIGPSSPILALLEQFTKKIIIHKFKLQ